MYNLKHESFSRAGIAIELRALCCVRWCRRQNHRTVPVGEAIDPAGHRNRDLPSRDVATWNGGSAYHGGDTYPARNA